MSELLDMILERLPSVPRSFDTADDPGFWSDGELLLCPTCAECEFAANFLRDLFRGSTITIHTGYFDPFEDHNNRQCDDDTGFYYVSFDRGGS